MQLKQSRRISRSPAIGRLAAAALVFVAGLADAAVINVSTSAQLTAALINVAAGTTIQLAPGVYVGTFAATGVGTADAPIRLLGSSDAILESSSGTGYGLRMTNVQYWTLDGFSVTNAGKGIVLDGSSYNTLENLSVYGIGAEAVHFRSFSSYNTIEYSHIFNTGLVDPQFGEGVYIGSAKSNWGTYSGGVADASNYNRVISNVFGANVSAESVDIKEGTLGALIQNNSFDASGISGANFADSVVDVKGSANTLSGNVVQNLAHTGALLDGFQVHAISGVANSGLNNTFSGNSFDLYATGYGINVQSGVKGNVVCNTNTAVDTGKGVANVALSSCAQPVDEPGSVALLMLGGLGIGLVRRLRRRR